MNAPAAKLTQLVGAKHLRDPVNVTSASLERALGHRTVEVWAQMCERRQGYECSDTTTYIARCLRRSTKAVEHSLEALRGVGLVSRAFGLGKFDRSLGRRPGRPRRLVYGLPGTFKASAIVPSETAQAVAGMRGRGGRRGFPRSEPPSRNVSSEGGTPARVCEQCGGSLEGKRAHAKTCSTRCRIARHRGRAPMNVTVRPEQNGGLGTPSRNVSGEQNGGYFSSLSLPLLDSVLSLRERSAQPSAPAVERSEESSRLDLEAMWDEAWNKPASPSRPLVIPFMRSLHDIAAKTPEPPLLNPSDSPDLWVEWLAHSYEGAIRKLCKKRPWVFARWASALKKYEKVLTAAARRLIAHGIPPAKWCIWSASVWLTLCKEQGKKPSIPPVRWLFAAKRIDSSVVWYERDMSGPVGGVVSWTPTCKALLRVHGRLRYQGVGDLPLAEVQEQLEEAYVEARREAAKEQRRINERVWAGEFLW